MAKIYPLITFISKWEGGYVNDPSDPGGPTNKGITLKTWKKKGYDKNNDGQIDLSDLQQVTHQDMLEVVLRPHYWDPWQGDRINDQSVANIVVDWAWCSGAKTVPFVQWLLQVKPDGIVGPQTIKALNNYPSQEELFNKIKAERALNIRNLCKKRPELQRFKSGWLNRIADFKYHQLLIIAVLLTTLNSCLSGVRQPIELGAVAQQALKTEQAVATDEQRSLTTQTNHATQNSTSNTVEETLQVAFSLPFQAEILALQEHIQAVQTQLPSLVVPVVMHGIASMHRIHKTQKADTNKASSRLAQAVQQSASQLHQLYTADSLAYTRRVNTRRAITAQKLLAFTLLITGLFLIAYYYSKAHPWKSH